MIKTKLAHKISIHFCVVICCLFLSCSLEDGVHKIAPNIVPLPHSIDLTTDHLLLPKNLVYTGNIEKQALLGQFIQTNLHRIYSKQLKFKSTESIPLSFISNEALVEEGYILQIKKDSILISASDDFGFVRAVATLLQLPDEQGRLPIGIIEDAPDYDYRALMIDCSRSWYSVSTIKQIIDLCFWYKIKYLHLHLTDDALFTFSSTAFPKLASDQSYSISDLEDLNQYAIERGCILIPEIDMPGHASQFVAKYPDIFSIKEVDKNYWTINMGKESAYTAIETILKEVALAFPHSPYIHIGGDEFNANGMADDAETKAYMKKNSIATLDDLYHHFILRVSEMVKDLGKKPIIWSDFTNKGAVKVPNDVIVMLWKTTAYQPEELVDEGFQFINASWQPLYVVNNRKWTPKEIYNWEVTTWKSAQTPSTAGGVGMEPHQNLMGGSMSVWEQNEYKAIVSLRHRLAAMSERLWNTDAENYKNYANRSAIADQRLNRFLYGFELNEKGLLFPDWKNSNFDEHMWFDDSLSISAHPLQEDLLVGYHYFADINEKRTSPSSALISTLESDLIIKKGGPIMVQAYQNDKGKIGASVGHPIYKNYSLRPIHIETKGLVENYLPHNWEHHKFADSLEVRFSSKLNGDIYYTLDNKPPTILSEKYTEPFHLEESGTLKAKLFDSKSNEPIGGLFYQEYVKLGLEKSLTTGKPISTSNGELELGASTFINNGEIARWDHWGDHTDGENWVIVDLGKEEKINRFKTYTFWDGSRFYEYTIEVSRDNKNWSIVVDRSENREISTPEGITDNIEPTIARYLKLNLIRNSANPGLHLVEFNAF